MEYPKESEALTELRKIREALYEEMKDMTPQERVDMFNREAEKFEKEHASSLPREMRIKREALDMEYPKESEALTELRKIREELYEEMKDLTPQEQVDFFNREAELFEKEHGLKLPRVNADKERSA